MAVAESRRSLPRFLLPRIVAATVATCGSFMMSVGPISALETLAARLIATAFGVRTLTLSNTGTVIVGRETLIAELTRSCSSTAGIVGVLLLALAMRRSAAITRARAMVVAGLVLFVTNSFRVALVFVAGATWGRSGLVLWHEWIGPLFTVLGIAVATTWMLGYCGKRPRRDLLAHRTV
jgi:exosortase/archaeosortase family protein